jgi:hypothetical protein
MGGAVDNELVSVRRLRSHTFIFNHRESRKRSGMQIFILIRNMSIENTMYLTDFCMKNNRFWETDYKQVFREKNIEKIFV